jgi:hypothetical protein
MMMIARLAKVEKVNAIKFSFMINKLYKISLNLISKLI